MEKKRIITGQDTEITWSEENSQWEEIHRGYLSTRGFSRGTSLPDRLIRVWTQEEVDILNVKIDVQDVDRTSQKERIMALNKERAIYIAALPVAIGGYLRGHMGNPDELEDKYGNFAGTIPAKAADEGWDVPRLEIWAAKLTQE